MWGYYWNSFYCDSSACALPLSASTLCVVVLSLPLVLPIPSFVARVRVFSYPLPSKFFLLIFSCLLCYCGLGSAKIQIYPLIVSCLWSVSCFPSGAVCLPLRFCYVLSAKHVINNLYIERLELSNVRKVTCSAAAPQRLFLPGQASFSFLPQPDTLTSHFSTLLSHTAKSVK